MSLKYLYPAIIKGVRTAEALEKFAASENAPAETLQVKTEYDAILFEHVKDAALKDIYQSVMAHPAGRGAMYAAGAAVPLTAAGSYLMHRKGEETRDTVRDIRDKALQTAGGLAMIGGGLMGAHRAMQPKQMTENITYSMGNVGGKMVPQSVIMSKQGAAKLPSMNEEEELLEKLATVGYLDVVLEDQAKHGSTEEIRQAATETRTLNAEHGVHILKQLLR